MNLYIASLNLGFLREVISKSSIVGFIPTAGNVYDDPYFVREDLARIEKLECKIIDIDIDILSHEDAISFIEACDVLFVSGGNTFYLMQQLKEKAIISTITNFIASGRIYIGASAGGAICSPSLEPYKGIDDPTLAPRLDDFDGLSLVDYVVLPHYGKKKYLPKYHAVLEEFSDVYRMKLLHDDEVIKVINKTDYKIQRTESL